MVTFGVCEMNQIDLVNERGQNLSEQMTCFNREATFSGFKDDQVK